MARKTKIVIINSGYGNVQAISNILLSIGKDSIINNEIDEIKSATHLILPGIGSFDAAMNSIAPIKSTIREVVIIKKTNILGICLGMQLLGTKSEEGKKSGLDLIKGKIVRLSMKDKYRVPHLNWEYINFSDDKNIIKGYDSNPKFYFAHSYHFVPDDRNVIIATFSYPDNIVAMVKLNNICGVQFHPEKSHKYGQIFFKNYFELE